ncbi:restriction endonuclease [Comamonas sp. CMM02]|uniref:restriction endonuclease n=1 Tax=Comamonas sp. CMM02 TaxID=2769307 RepID=UPI00178743F8|nr:restriction endonuclease [Comamonas sp. CMM02]MBD9400917.1 restriction endonuclease [Comamonas sp. CMM02]
MKFKMAENSLFAILLRSRWWISFAVGAGWALLAAALVPQPYKIIAILGSLPFWALGFVAFVRQYDQPTPAQQQALLDMAAQDNWNDFASHLERAWKIEGYEVARSPAAAADFVLTRNGKTTLVQAKRWKAATHGVEPLRALHQAMQVQKADECAYACIAPLQDTAQRFADEQHVAILQGLTLATLLQKPLMKQPE